MSVRALLVSMVASVRTWSVLTFAPVLMVTPGTTARRILTNVTKSSVFMVNARILSMTSPVNVSLVSREDFVTSILMTVLRNPVRMGDSAEIRLLDIFVIVFLGLKESIARVILTNVKAIHV